MKLLDNCLLSHKKNILELPNNAENTGSIISIQSPCTHPGRQKKTFSLSLPLKCMEKNGQKFLNLWVVKEPNTWLKIDLNLFTDFNQESSDMSRPKEEKEWMRKF